MARSDWPRARRICSGCHLAYKTLHAIPVFAFLFSELDAGLRSAHSDTPDDDVSVSCVVVVLTWRLRRRSFFPLVLERHGRSFRSHRLFEGPSVRPSFGHLRIAAPTAKSRLVRKRAEQPTTGDKPTANRKNQSRRLSLLKVHPVYGIENARAFRAKPGVR